MPATPRIEANTLFTAEISLPPPYTLVRLREVGDAFAHAQRIAPKMGAGTLVYVGRFDLAEFAVVLEPEEPLRTARRAFYAGMAALADALTALAPPEKPLDIVWPDMLRIDLGLVGGARLAWPLHAREDQTPEWLVLGAAIRTVSLADEPGINPLSTALAACSKPARTSVQPIWRSPMGCIAVTSSRWEKRSNMSSVISPFKARFSTA